MNGKKTNISYTYNTDVLVVGGSGAGVMSAVNASKGRCSVLLVSKGKIGRSGNVIMAGGGCGIDGESGKEILGMETADETFTRERLYDCLVKESFYLAEQNMVRQYVEDAPLALKDYLEWAEECHCKFVPIQPCGWQFSGLEFAKPLLKGIQNNPEINVLEDSVIIDLIKQEERVTGAVGIHFYSGEFFQVNAKVTILATGGYQPLSLKNTVSDMTGDGQAMAYRAGAVLSDMEFLLAFPTALVPEDMTGSIYPYLFRRIPHVMADKNGNEIQIDKDVKKLSTESKLNKLVNCYYLGHAVANGLGGPHGGAYWDYSKASEEEKRDGFDRFYKRFSLWHKYGYYKGENLKRIENMVFHNEPIEIGLGVEYSMGGIVVNENMETGIAGLLAAGEVTAGTFGACRVGDGLIEMLAHGRKAGQTAAAYCHFHELAKTDDALAEELVCKALSFLENEDGPEAMEVFNRMEKICDKGLGVIRNEKDMVEALEELGAMKKNLSGMKVVCKSRKYNFEWLRALQAQNMMICDEAALRAAIERKESRGCHIRKDYEQVDHENYLHHYQFRKNGSQMEMFKKRPTIIDAEPPKGTAENVLSYFTDPKLQYDRSFKITF